MNDCEGNSERINWKYVAPQIYSALIVTAFNLNTAMSFSYPTFLIPQLEDEKSDIKVTISQSSWTATLPALTQTILMLFHGFFVHKFGSLLTMKMSAVPGIAGWVIVASARDIHSLLLGRFLTGLSVALASASNVYVTETTRPDIRGSLLTLLPAYIAIGSLFASILGYFCHWRTLAWIYTVTILLPVVFSFLLSDSPIWLIYKGRLNEAKSSLRIFNRLYPNPEQETEKQFEELLRDHKLKISENNLHSNVIKQIISNYSKPTGYKPLLLCLGLFFFQEFSGISIILVHTIIFFKSIDSDIDENLVPIILSIVNLIMSIGIIFLMKHYTKRQLIITSNIGMIICIFISATYTNLIQNGKSDLKWIPLCFIILFMIFSLAGMLPIPWILTSEIQPTTVRGFSNGISTAIGNGMMSLALQNYRYIQNSLGIDGIQFLFGIVTMFSTVFAWLFLPDTKDKKLIEIEEYFENNWIYPLRKKKGKKVLIEEGNMEMAVVDSKEINRR